MTDIGDSHTKNPCEICTFTVLYCRQMWHKGSVALHDHFTCSTKYKHYISTYLSFLVKKSLAKLFSWKTVNITFSICVLERKNKEAKHMN